MQYRPDPKTGAPLSILGMGCMRFPANTDKTEQLIMQAIDAGINYFDTGYIYGHSEEKLGEALRRNNARDKVYISTKLPVILLRKAEDIDRIFQIQLKRLQTDHIDYYLMHMLTDAARWDKLRAWGIEEWIAKQKAAETIGQIGFSYHGGRQDFIDLLDAYDWDACMIQYNYYDENNQAGMAGLKRAKEKGLPVIIMEPLLGGKLATGLPQKAVNAFKKADPNLTPAGWALRWLWNQPEVTVVLSGMSDETQLAENVKTAANARPVMLNDRQLAVYGAVRETMKHTKEIPCTGCHYCMPCPRGVNIPLCFSSYNTSRNIGYVTGLKLYVMGAGMVSTKAETGSARRCNECGRCEPHCPQGIAIRRDLRTVRKRLEPFWVRGIMALARKFVIRD